MKKYLLTLVLLASIASSTILPAQAQVQRSNDLKISRSITTYAEVLRLLDRLFVDSLDIEKMSKKGIDAMLKELDPYTEYYSEADLQRANMITKGEYAGIGTLLVHRNGATVVRQVYDESPAQRAKILAADTLVAIDGKSVVGLELKQVTDRIAGEPNTPIELTIRRHGVAKPLTFNLTREVIRMPVISYSGMLTDGVGYLRLASFSSDRTAGEVRKALTDLMNQGAKSLVFDLRNNGGGRMDQAIDICGFFLPKGSKILSVRGKQPESERVFHTSEDPIAPDMPMVMLVNGHSASASEIVAGAMQDYDRAVIVGTRSFGKGLVQTVTPMPYRAQMKYTNAKYYIPSGRCVQAIVYDHSNPELKTSVVPDSLLKPFTTLAGRTVYEGSGVMPDIEIKHPEAPGVLGAMAREDMLFDFVTLYQRKHPQIAPIDRFVVTPQLVLEYKQWLRERKFEFKNESQVTLEKLIKQSKADKTYAANKAIYDRLTKSLKLNVNKEIDAALPLFKDGVASEMIYRYYGNAGLLQYRTRVDAEVKKAIELLTTQQAEYKRILKK